MRTPVVLLLPAVVAGLVAGRFVTPPEGWTACAALLALYILTLLAFARRPALFVPLVLAAFAWSAWLLAAQANRLALHPTLVAGVARADGPRSSRAADSERSAQVPDTPVLLEGIVRQDASGGPNGVNVSLDVTAVEDLTGQGASPGCGTGPEPCAHGRRLVGVCGGVSGTIAGRLAATRLDEWRAGRVVRMPALLREPTTFRNPGGRDERLALARRGVNLFASVKSAALVEVVRRGRWWDERAAEFRAFARRALNAAVGRWSPQSAAIVIAILIGDRAGLSSDVERRLQEAGTYHVIAISGGNIAILAGFLLGLFRLLEVRTRLAACCTAVVLVAYAHLVGGGASVVRATLMAVTYLAALAFDLRSSPLNALLAAACAILCATPLALYDVAFALTFGATLGILAASRRMAAWMPRRWWLRAPAGLLLASASAELALLPVGAYAFSRVTFAGLLLNFVAIPLMAVAQLVGMLVLPLAVIDARLAAAAGFVAHLGAAGLVSSASLVDRMPALTWRVPAPDAGLIALYYAAFALWAVAASSALGRARHARVALRGVATLMLATSAIGILWSPLARLRGRRPTGLLRLTVVDVGQADALLARFPDAETMLVDAGGSRAGGGFDVGSRVIAPVLWHHDVFTIDRFVLSHGDPDHLGGAVALMRAFTVGEIWEGIDVPRDPLLQQMHVEAASRRIPSRRVRAGDRIAIGGTEVTVWHPPPPDWERQKVRNEDSVVLEIRFRDVSLLLTGDVGAATERGLARQLRVAPLCVMKVPHHGSTGSSSAPLVAATHPALAIFTVGASGLAAPGLQAVMERYKSVGAHVVCTGDDGAVDVETDGVEVRVTTFRGRRFTLTAR